ncbi:MAG: TonB-dependent siderophore receptor [Verrucomicrobiota bacterium]
MNEQRLKPFAALLLVPGLSPALAQDTNAVAATPAAVNTNAATQLPEMIVQGQNEPAFKSDQVSSPKFTQPLLDTPQTIVAIPKEVYTMQSAQTLTDVLRNTPGISFAAGEGGNVAAGDSFFMRGFDASGNIFVDGVRDSGAYSRDIFNLEQVEIAKGPAGADNGRGGSSGYINLATKSAMLQRAYAGTASYGSAETWRGTVDMNQPLGLGSKGDWINGSSLRLNGIAQDGGVPGRDYVENNRWGVAPALALGLGTPTRLHLSASWLEQQNLPDSGLPVAALPGGVLGAVRQNNFYGLAREDYDHVTSLRVTARAEHDFSEDFTLRNQFTYSRNDRDALTTYIQNASSINTNSGVVTPRRIHLDAQNEIFSEQLNGTFKLYTGRLEHDLSGGLEFTRESQFSPTWTAVNGPGTGVYLPNPFRAATPGQLPVLTNNAFTDSSIDTAAGYIFGTTKVNDHLQLNASVRGEHYQTEYRSRSTAGVNGPSIETDDTLLSWKAGIVFKPRENGSVYFSYANSFTPPGTTFTLSTNANNANNPVFEPQENINYEIGTKWNFFHDRLSTSLALYRSENLNNIVQDSTTQDYLQDAKNTVEGVEFGISGKITERWMVFGGFGYAHSEYAAPSSSNSGTNSGAALRFTPEWSANLWTAYKFKSGLTIGGGAQYSSSVLRSTGGSLKPTATAGIEAPDYLVFNSMLAYEFSKNFSVRLNVNNLFAAQYYRLNNNGGRYYPGTPRSFTLAAEWSF